MDSVAVSAQPDTSAQEAAEPSRADAPQGEQDSSPVADNDETQETAGHQRPAQEDADAQPNPGAASERGKMEGLDEATHAGRRETLERDSETSLAQHVDTASSQTGQTNSSVESAIDSEPEQTREPSEFGGTTTDTDTCDEESFLDDGDNSLDRRHSVRTEALIQAAARAVVSLAQERGNEAQGERDGQQHSDHEEADGSILSSAPSQRDNHEETVYLGNDNAEPSRPGSSFSGELASPTEHSSEGDGTESSSRRGAEDDVFSDRSPRSSVHSADEHSDDDALEQMTEKGDQSPYARSRVTSGVSMSGGSELSDFSRLSRYEKEDFIPTSRHNRPAFRSPSSVRAMQMSSPSPSLYSSPNKSAKRPAALPTISRLGSPTVSGQFSPKGRSTPSRFKKQEAPLVLLHVTLLPLRWTYGDMVNHFEAKKLPPIAFSSEGLKNLRGAWRQLQDRLGDTVLERGILLPHPQNDYEILEERMLEALELPLRRRARILECGHYLGPSNAMTVDDDAEDDSEDVSDSDEFDARAKQDKRHWCKTCKGDIKYEELGSERVFRIKVYASNGLMSAGAWEACWREMERVDIEVEPIIDSNIQPDLAKLTAVFEQEQQKQLEQEQSEEEQRLQLEEEQRLALIEERHQLEAQRQQFEEERIRSMEDARRELEQQRIKIEQEQRQRLEEERRQQFDEERQLLDAQRQQFEEQRLELEQQRKLVEEEQRQHLEEARRQELEEEQRQIEEQRQQLEDARQQFEEERRQRLEEEEELRRLQREEDEQRQMAAARSTSRTSYVEDELMAPSPEPTAASSDLDGRRRDSARLREIYGEHGRTLSEGVVSNSSPSIHIHMDSARQRDEEKSSRQLATIPAPQDSGMMQIGHSQETRHSGAFMASPSPHAAPEQAYQRQEDRRKSLETASLPELVGETIRVLLQDPKNVFIAILVVCVAVMAGQYTRGEERGVDIYKPQQQQHKYQHQLDARDPVGQVIINTPAAQQQHGQQQTQSQLVETVYKTVTAEAAPPNSAVSLDVETVYQTVTKSRVVETVFTTVTESLVEPSADSAAVDVASELAPTRAGPSVDSSFLPLEPPSSPVLDLWPDASTPSAYLDPATDQNPISDDEFSQSAVPSRPGEEQHIGPEIDMYTSTPTSLASGGAGKTRTIRVCETVTETVLETPQPTRAAPQIGAAPFKQDDPCAGIADAAMTSGTDLGHHEEILLVWETLTRTLKVTSTVGDASSATTQTMS